MKIEKSEPFNSSGALLVCSEEKMIFAPVRGIFFIAFVHTNTQACAHTHTHTHTHTHSCTILARNYTNLMPRSPLLIPSSVHIFILALNEGAATCFTPNKREVRFILHLGQCGWVAVVEEEGRRGGELGRGGGSCMGITRPLKEGPRCQLPAIIKQRCRVYH